MSKYSIGYTINGVPGIYHCLQDGEYFMDALCLFADHLMEMEKMTNSIANVLWVYEIGCRPI